MPHVPLPVRARPGLLVVAVIPMMLAACASAPSATVPSTWSEGAQATVEGTVTKVDTDPWAYDGNAQVVIASDVRGAVSVSLPARWNLCKARGVDQAGALKAGDRVRATGTVDAQGALLVCEQPTHRLERLAP